MRLPSKSQNRATGLTDLIDYHSLVADGVLLLESGIFLAAWEMRGPDFSAYGFHEAEAICHRISQRLHLGSGWVLECNQMREPVAEYAPAQAWPDPVSQLVEEERRAQFTRTDAKAHYRSHYYFSASYQPPRKQKALDWTFEESGNELGQAERDLRYFLASIEDIEAALRSNLQREKHTLVRRLKSHGTPGRLFCDLCRSTRYCVSGEDFPFALPDEPTFLNYLFAPDHFTPGRALKLGEKHLRVLAVDSFPGASF